MTRIHYRTYGYTSGQAALVLGISVRELEKLIAAGRLPVADRTATGQRRFDPAAVDRLLRESE